MTTMSNNRLGRTTRTLYPRRTAPIADRGTIISIVSWLLLAIVVCILIARFAVKLSLKTRRKKLGLDDLFITLSALFSFGQTIAVSIEAMEVLGQHTHDLTGQQTVVYQKVSREQIHTTSGSAETDLTRLSTLHVSSTSQTWAVRGYLFAF